MTTSDFGGVDQPLEIENLFPKQAHYLISNSPNRLVVESYGAFRCGQRGSRARMPSLRRSRSPSPSSKRLSSDSIIVRVLTIASLRALLPDHRSEISYGVRDGQRLGSSLRLPWAG
jgi:hypothetical protein